MSEEARGYIRKGPKPTVENALGYARSVMVARGAFKDWGDYKYEDGLTIESAIAALKQHADSQQETMALEMCLYAMEK
jgi:uncharacterized protein Yka (UPF0111/DUF47 family)